LRVTLPAALLLMLAGSMTTTFTRHGASSWRSASASAAGVCWRARSRCPVRARRRARWQLFRRTAGEVRTMLLSQRHREDSGGFIW